jgi:hypothetical protein
MCFSSDRPRIFMVTVERQVVLSSRRTEAKTVKRFLEFHYGDFTRRHIELNYKGAV